jgi:hypothetical protein
LQQADASQKVGERAIEADLGADVIDAPAQSRARPAKTVS